MDWMTNWIFELLYGFQKTICYIIDFIQEIFYTLAEINSVTIDDKQTDLLSHFLLSNTVKTTFLYVFLIATILLVVFTLIAIIRSEYANGENKKSKTIILSKSFQSFILFLIVPFVLIAGITLTNTVMGAINLSMNPYAISVGGQTTIGGQILVTSGKFAYIGAEDERIAIEQMFLTGQLDYFNTSIVSEYYSLRNLDFLIGIFGSIVIMVMFVMSAITFIQRIFDIVLLYIIAPVSVSTIPVDDGNRFRIWKDMVISKVLGAYGIIISMNLFFIIIPQVSSIVFFTDSFKNGIINILFLIGGAFAVTKANLVIAQLTGNTAGQNETQQFIRNMQTGGHIAKATLGTGASIAGAVLGGRRFIDAKKSTKSFFKGMKNSILPTNNANSNNKTNNTNNPTKSGAVKKLATMPISAIKNLADNGVIGLAKGLIPRRKTTNSQNGGIIENAQNPNIENKEQDTNNGENNT